MDPSKSIPPPAHPDEIDRVQARELGRERVVKRRERISRIRKRIVAGSVLSFLIAWGAIFFQLASGHDPSLSKTAQASTAATPTSSSASASTGSSSSDYTDSGDSYSNDSSSNDSYSSNSPSTGSTQSPSAVTTQQS
jgi:cytoskeletal protein RodZ